MKCPSCDHQLKLQRRLVSESEDRIKTYTCQWWKCRHCRSVWFGELTEYVSDGSYEYAFYAADPEVWEQDLRLVRKCKRPLDPFCSCAAHETHLFTHYTNRIDYSYRK